MIPRVWVCTEQPLVLELLALPLHLLVLVALVVCWGGLRLAHKRNWARSVWRVLLTLGAALGSLSLGFALVGWLLGLAINPTPFLSLAPWSWALAGPVALWLGVRRARAAVASGERSSKPLPDFDALATFSAVVVFVVIAGRRAIPDPQNNMLSLPYSLFEWGVVDELGPVTDECLAERVLEYSRDDDIGRSAINQLAGRGPSAAPGIRARLAELYAHWPPPADTVKQTGIFHLLQLLASFGDKATVRQWKELDWWRNFPNPKPAAELQMPP